MKFKPKKFIGLLLSMALALGLGPDSSIILSAQETDQNAAEDGTCEGLFTTLPDGVTITGFEAGTLPYKEELTSGWRKSDLTHNGKTVWESNPTTDTATELFKFSEQVKGPFVILLDYCFIKAPDSDGMFGLDGKNDKYLSVSSSKDPTCTREIDDPATLTEDDWKPLYVKAFNDSNYIALSHKVTKPGTGLGKVYVSNIRIYDPNNIPESEKVSLTMTFNKEHFLTQAEGARYDPEISNGSSYAGDWNKLESPVTMSCYLGQSIRFSAYLKEDVELRGIESNDPINWKVSVDSNGRQELKWTPTKPGNDYTAAFNTVEYHPSPLPENIRLLKESTSGWQPVSLGSGKNGVLADEKLPEKAQGDYFWYKWNFGEQNKQKLRLEYDKSESLKYVKLTEGEQEYLPQSGENNKEYIEFIAQDKEGKLVLRSKSSDPNLDEAQVNLYLWPSLDWDQAFGDSQEDGTKKIANLSWKDGKQNGSQTVKYKPDIWQKGSNLNQTTEITTFEFNPSLPESLEMNGERAAIADEDHPVIFTSPIFDGPASVETNMFFTAQTPGVLTYDYLVYSPDGNIRSRYFRAVSDEKVDVEERDTAFWTTHSFTFTRPGQVYNLSAKFDSGAFAAISNLRFYSRKLTQTFSVKSEDGTGTGTISEKNGLKEGPNDIYVGQNVDLSAAPDENSVFLGWYSGNTLLSLDGEYSFLVSDETRDIEAHFAARGTSVAQVDAKLYDSLTSAFNESEAGAVIKLIDKNYTCDKEPSSEIVVPKGKTLLIPCSPTDSGYQENGFSPEGTRTSPRTGPNPDNENRYLLSLTQNRSLKIEGTVLVNAQTGRPASGHLDQDVNGGYGQINLEGTISVASGGVLDVYGYICGNGTITAEEGALVQDLFVVRNWRGGSQAFALFPNVYPMNQSDMHNIEVPLEIKAGASLKGSVKMYAAGLFSRTHFPQIDNGNGLIRLNSGSVRKTLKSASSGAEAREKLELNGSGALSFSELNIVGFMLSTGDFDYPIDGDTDIELTGDWSISDRFKFMPGATVLVKEDSTLAIDQITARSKSQNRSVDNGVVFYDSSWEDKVTTGSNGTAYPTKERGDARLILEPGARVMANGALAGKIEAASNTGKDKPAIIIFNGPVNYTTQEANGYYSAPVDDQLIKSFEHKATIEGTEVTQGKAYVIWNEGGKTLFEEKDIDVPAAPEVSYTDVSTDTAADGTITVSAVPGQSYEVLKPGESIWTDVPENGVLTGLSAGTYEVRVKATASTFEGLSAVVTIGVKPASSPQPGGGSSSSTSSSTRPSTPSTVTNPDGSTTTTQIDSAGNKTTTTEKTDGSKEVVEEKADGSTITTTTNADGSSQEKVEAVDGTITTKTESADGTKEEKVEKTNGSISTKTEFADGTKQDKEEKADGSIETLTTRVDGSTEKVEESADKKTINTTNTDTTGSVSEIKEAKAEDGSTASIEGSISITPEKVAQATSAGSNVTITMPEIPANKTGWDVQLDVQIPENVESATIEIPVDADTIEPGSVAMIEDEQGNLVPIAESIGKDGKLIVPLSKNCKIIIKDNKKNFLDVTGPTTDYPANGIAFLSARNLMTGAGDGTRFDLTGKVTRAQLATILYRYRGEPDTTGMALPAGAAENDWYSNAAKWATTSGLMGVGSNFNAGSLLTREQLAMILWRLEGTPDAGAVDFSKYSDFSSISTPEMQKAVGWAVKSGLMGKGTSRLNASGSSQRQELAAILSRYLSK